MHSPIALLYIILIVEAYTAMAATKSVTPMQDTEDIEKRSKIGLGLYSERDCGGDLRVMDDLTTLAKQPAPDGNWFINDPSINSFTLIGRNLEGQEQLDVSAMTLSNGDKCGVFIRSYSAGTTTVCNNVENIDCVRLWDNSGL